MVFDFVFMLPEFFLVISVSGLLLFGSSLFAVQTESRELTAICRKIVVGLAS